MRISRHVFAVVIVDEPKRAGLPVDEECQQANREANEKVGERNPGNESAAL
jgi:hypothetical protein